MIFRLKDLPVFAVLTLAGLGIMKLGVAWNSQALGMVGVGLVGATFVYYLVRGWTR